MTAEVGLLSWVDHCTPLFELYKSFLRHNARARLAAANQPPPPPPATSTPMPRSTAAQPPAPSTSPTSEPLKGSTNTNTNSTSTMTPNPGSTLLDELRPPGGAEHGPGQGRVISTNRPTLQRSVSSGSNISTAVRHQSSDPIPRGGGTGTVNSAALSHSSPGSSTTRRTNPIPALKPAAASSIALPDPGSSGSGSGSGSVGSAGPSSLLQAHTAPTPLLITKPVSPPILITKPVSRPGTGPGSGVSVSGEAAAALPPFQRANSGGGGGGSPNPPALERASSAGGGSTSSNSSNNSFRNPTSWSGSVGGGVGGGVGGEGAKLNPLHFDPLKPLAVFSEVIVKAIFLLQ